MGKVVICNSMGKKKVNNDQFLDLLEGRAAEYRSFATQSGGWGHKLLAEWLGVEPWRVIVPLAIVAGMGMVLLLRGWAVKGVSMLQYGF